MTNEEIKRKALSYLGLAKRSGRIAVGTDAVLDQVRRKNGKVAVILASDASDRTKKQVRDKCAHYGADILSVPITGDEAAHAIGSKMTVSSIAVTEPNLASALLSLEKGGASARQ